MAFSLYTFVNWWAKKKSVTGLLGLIADFLFFGFGATPLSTLVLAAENDLYDEEDNKANKVVNGADAFHGYVSVA